MRAITTNYDILKDKCNDVETYQEGLAIVGKLKWVALCSKNCVGLAHNQIRGNKNVYVVLESSKGFVGYVNPKIIKRSQETYITKEGCMSYPKAKATKVIRHDWIEIEHLTKEGIKTEKFHGAIAQRHQHEADHLVGIDIHHKPIGDHK
jgi:peptide deformylase